MFYICSFVNSRMPKYDWLIFAKCVDEDVVYIYWKRASRPGIARRILY